MNKKERQKRRKRKILLALLLLLLTGAVLSTGTYAWFTSNKTVTVDDITVNVASSNGLQISANAIAFTPVISNTDITGAKTNGYGGAVNVIPSGSSTLAPVSTIGEIDTNNGFIKMYRGEITADGASFVLSTERSEEDPDVTNAGDFIAFDIFLQVVSPSQVYITSNSNVAADGVSSGIENAARMAFVYEGFAPIGSAPAIIQGLKATNTTFTNGNNVQESTVKIWELYNDTHTSSGVENGVRYYAPHDADVATMNVGTGNAALTYYGVNSVFTNQPIGTTVADYVTQMNPTWNTPSTGIPTTTYEPFYYLNAGINKIRVYMWVEGQDIDCEDNASGGSIVYSLQFSLNNQAA